nr:immunoglobulin heavy chain junction region [Mus musculus]MBK4195654.1 immunoglobulin heavy chain junction region [Mus musculus]MBK4195657.1 immunoglobulin heavy chain junction region [Mus musculus]
CARWESHNWDYAMDYW